MNKIIARLTVCAAALGISIATPAFAQQIGASPTFGRVSLSAGFMPDPHRVDIVAGGTIDVAQTRGGNCVGKIANAPDFTLNYDAGSAALVIKATSSQDTTLIVNSANGAWYCNDDSNGVNPGIRISNPPSGLYEIWVGTYEDEPVSATILISEVY